MSIATGPLIAFVRMYFTYSIQKIFLLYCGVNNAICFRMEKSDDKETEINH
jgi:hypothetical protein